LLTGSRRLRRVALVLMVLPAAVTSACGGEPAEEGEVVDRTVDRSLVVEVEGDRRIDFDGEATLHVVTRVGEGEEADVSVAAIELTEPLVLESGATVALEVGVVGLYDGDGEYTLPAGLGLVKPASAPPVSSASSSSESFSQVSVLFYELDENGEPVSEERFGYLAEPCRITLRDHATSGEVECPALWDSDGRSVSLTATWRDDG
jgi:hypothetical protein